ncbi:hypothetical protein FRZ40_31350 [Paraburkholderia azotifigens]|uniref:Lipoprotein n=1 Tax=Paraburkholderia azotifigens TaxID=2057004 RepID=A0A5C6VJV2_9BURK|nr:hypothetical protein FRZ40_31350 [Paraburkholderia azotifigens]
MKPVTRDVSAALMAMALAVGAAACKKVDESSSNTMESGSSGVMSNTAGMSGTPGKSAAAQSASDNASGAVAPSPSSVAPVANTPGSTTSAAPSGASQ